MSSECCYGWTTRKRDKSMEQGSIQACDPCPTSNSCPRCDKAQEQQPGYIQTLPGSYKKGCHWGQLCRISGLQARLPVQRPPRATESLSIDALDNKGRRATQGKGWQIEEFNLNGRRQQLETSSMTFKERRYKRMLLPSSDGVEKKNWKKLSYDRIAKPLISDRGHLPPI